MFGGGGCRIWKRRDANNQKMESQGATPAGVKKEKVARIWCQNGGGGEWGVKG